jgi:peptidoglycan-associated lipoprotein
MKLNKFVLPLVLALSAALATTSCKSHQFPKVTNIPNHGGGNTGGPAVANDNPSPTIGNTTPIDTSGQAPVVTPRSPDGHFETAPFNIDNYTPDPAALAAYTVHFKFDSAVVEDAEQANVASVAQALTDQNLRLLIQGHCDERGTEEYNRALGERRALALREALAKVNVDPMHIKTISFGKDQPVDPGHDEAAWSKNRRGVFILLHPKAPVQ